MNYQLFQLLNGLAGRVDSVDDLMEFAAELLIFVSFAITGWLAARSWWQGRRRPVIDLGGALAIAFLMGTALSRLNHQVRPFQTHQVTQLIAHDPGVSLPSDHATAAFAMAFAVAAFLHRRWGVALTVIAAAVGFARVWVGVHYLGDIAAAAIIAALGVGTVVLLRRLSPDEVTARRG
ncbi:phosphatase PAP2 family protein [Actinoplanes sp. HUAS TT8]|uniref:phosphatase PAP2 family protein n=1 Tax=Actinoplanes sp. HUAS TT8 TaxID=3447453 RepID=UPI003F521985